MRQRGAQRIVATAVAAATAAAASAGAAAAAPGPPGPPPGAGAGLPLPPAAGSEPAPPPPGPPAALPATVAGPALVDGTARVAASGRVRLRIACARDGRAALTVAALGARPLARAGYRCRGRRATVALRTSRRVARRLARLGTAIGRVRLRQRGADVAVAVALAARGPATADWSDGGLQCASPGPRQAYLVAPNFTVTPPTTIDVRPWIAWYTDAGGWRWLGLRGVGASRWTRLTATPAGVAQWLGAAGALDPWTWGPVTVPAGGTWAVGVFEVVYWYGGRPTYVWRTTRSHVTATATGPFCAFP